MNNAYTKRPVAQVTTQDLIATIAADRNDFATFEARHAFKARTGSDWRTFAPAKPRIVVNPGDGGGPCYWHNFVESGEI